MSTDPIHCLQTVSMDKTYLLPSSAVLDILPYSPYDPAKAKDFVLGHFTWREKRIPILEFSLQVHEQDVTPLTHIMIVQCPFEDSLILFGTLISQIPNALSVLPEDLVFEGEPLNHLHGVRGATIQALLVDLAALGEILSNKVLS